MAITIYRRHKKKSAKEWKVSCVTNGMTLAKDALDTYEFCDCPTYFFGTLNGKTYPRKATGFTTWKETVAFKRNLEATEKDPVVHGPTLKDCIRRFLAGKDSQIASSTIRSYTLLMKRLEEFAGDKQFIRDLDADFFDDFVNEGLPTLGDTSKTPAVAKLRCFLRWAKKKDWTTVAMAEKIEPFESSSAAPVVAFTDEEIDTMMNYANTVMKDDTEYGKDGPRFALQMRLMLEMGLRDGDSVLFNPAKCYDPFVEVHPETGKQITLWMYDFTPQKTPRKKRGTFVATIFIEDSLIKAIRACKWMSDALPFAYLSVKDLLSTDKELRIAAEKNLNKMSGQVRERMQTMEKKTTCNIPKCHPHRLRHTYAYRSLLAGMMEETLSTLMVHSSLAITRTHYGKWCKKRKAILRKIAAQFFVGVAAHHPASLPDSTTA